MARAAPASLAQTLWPARPGNQVVRAVVLAVVGSALLTASAKVQVPFFPVPMTMQTMVVLLLGMTLEPWLALATVLFYLGQGALGLPVFAGTPEKGIGLAYMAGPTGGYLAGFALSAFAVSWIAARQRDLPGLAMAALMGFALIYLPGVLWLSSLIGLEQALLAGVAPFVLGDVLKAALAVAIVLGATTFLERRRDA